MVLDMHFIFWFPFVVLLLHTIEELPGFSSWTTRHFAPMSTYKHALIQSVILLFVLLISYRSSLIGYHGIWVVLAASFQLHIGWNALFHVVTTIQFREYSPGLLTAITLSIPSTLFFFININADNRLTISELVGSLLLGTLIAAVAIGTLFIGRKKSETRNTRLE